MITDEEKYLVCLGMKTYGGLFVIGLNECKANQVF